MKGFRLCIAAVGFGLIAAACGGASAEPTQIDSEELAARQVRSALTDANSLALDYGREHLGHYLRLKPSKFADSGLRLPDGVSLSFKTTHVSYCIKATSAKLPETHPWAIATAGPKSTSPSPHNSCPKFRY